VVSTPGWMIRNLTPHPVVVRRDGLLVAEIPSSGIARATQHDEPIGAIDGIPIIRATYGPTVGLPPPQPGVLLIVSLVTAQAAAREGRTTTDLLVPSQPVRDEQGRVIGCHALAAFGDGPTTLPPGPPTPGKGVGRDR
jgi:hypothetical protein